MKLSALVSTASAVQWSVFALLILVCSTAANAEDSTNDSPEETPEWFVWGGLTNYRLKLAESEKQIDAEINGVLGRLLPNWNEPETFGDWSRDLKLWDVWLGIGRDLGPRSAWFVNIGGGAGTIENSNRYYPLGVPIRVHSDFERREITLAAGLDYYPLGKPACEMRNEKSLLDAWLGASKPVVSCAGGYNRQNVLGDVRIDVLSLDRVYRNKQENAYDLFFLNPRLSIETALSPRNSVFVSVGYLFFDTHGDEFNGTTAGVYFRHRF